MRFWLLVSVPLKKEKLVIIPLCMGLVLILYSWYLSFPVYIDSRLDFVFFHISPLYWLGLPLLLGSLYILATWSKNKYVLLIICICIVMSMYSLNFFYYFSPGSDVQHFRGLTEYLIKTNDLRVTRENHMYYQWPSFFILAQIVTSLTGIESFHYEFILYVVIGVLYVTCLYTYASHFSRSDAYIAVIAYFICTYWFLFYEAVPYSLALGLLFLLLMLETFTKTNRKLAVIKAVVFVSMSFMHPFLSSFFVVYMLAAYLIDRNKKDSRFFWFTLVFYFAVSIYCTVYFFPYVVEELTRLYTNEFFALTQHVLEESIAPTPIIDAIAQAFSRVVVITTCAISGLGFLLLLIKRNLRNVDKAILVFATFYAVLGSLLAVLGTRSITFLFIPISLGSFYFLRTRYRAHLKWVFLILIVLLPLLPLHRSFYDVQISFQSREEHCSSNFLINHYNWTKQFPSIFSHIRTRRYLTGMSAIDIRFGDDYRPDFAVNVTRFDCVFVTLGLKKRFFLYNFSESILLDSSDYNKMYDSSFSYVAMRTKEADRFVAP
jgi:hypothetical protein